MKMGGKGEEEKYKSRTVRDKNGETARQREKRGKKERAKRRKCEKEEEGKM